MQLITVLVPRLPKAIDTINAESVRRLAIRWKIVHPVPHGAFMERIALLRKSDRLDGTHAYSALALHSDAFKRWLSERKTPIVVGRHVGYLMHIHRVAGSGRASISSLRARVRTLARRGAIGNADLLDALYMPQSKWHSRIGSGRAKPFTYQGWLFPKLRGKSFASISWFLQAANSPVDKKTVWNRMKYGWSLDDAISEPVVSSGGIIYRANCLATRLSYIGLTTRPLPERLAGHSRQAMGGSGYLFHQALVKYGIDQFEVEVVESVPDAADLGLREQHWISETKSRHPTGYNMSGGGQTGSARGRRVSVDGKTYQSLASAGRALAIGKGISPYVARTRLASGQPVPDSCRPYSDHPDSKGASDANWFWRIHKSLLKRMHAGRLSYPVADEWHVYENFKRDLYTLPRPAGRLIPRDHSKALGPENFQWASRREVVLRSHGKRVTVHGTTYPSWQHAADTLGIPVSTLKYRVRISRKL